MTLILTITELNGYRAYYGDPRDSSVRTLVSDVRENGITEPLLVSTDGTHALLEDGNKRLNLAAELGLTELPVTVVHRTYPWKRRWMPGQYATGALLAHLEEEDAD
jgi:ParB-like chromosome segregation protein Spo0J